MILTALLYLKDTSTKVIDSLPINQHFSTDRTRRSVGCCYYYYSV